jgi:hypothetical protein
VGIGEGVSVEVSVGGIVNVKVTVGVSLNKVVVVGNSGASVSLTINVGDIGCVSMMSIEVGDGGISKGRTLGTIAIIAAHIVTIAPIAATIIAGFTLLLGVGQEISDKL